MNASKLFKVLVMGGAALTAGATTQAGCASDDPEPAPTGTKGDGSAGAGGSAGQAASGGAGSATGGTSAGGAGASGGGAGAPGGAAGAAATGQCEMECATQQKGETGACVGFPCCWEKQACCTPCCTP